MQDQQPSTLRNILLPLVISGGLSVLLFSLVITNKIFYAPAASHAAPLANSSTPSMPVVTTTNHTDMPTTSTTVDADIEVVSSSVEIMASSTERMELLY